MTDWITYVHIERRRYFLLGFIGGVVSSSFVIAMLMLLYPSQIDTRGMIVSPDGEIKEYTYGYFPKGDKQLSDCYANGKYFPSRNGVCYAEDMK